MAITDPTTGQPYGDNVNPFESTKPIADPKLAEQMQKDYQTIFGNKPQNAPAPSGGVVNPGETVEQRNARLGFGGTPAPVSTPTPTPAPTDTQTQQPQTQMTDASNAEYQALQDQSQFFADKYTQLQSEFDNYTADIARIDSENHPMIQNIKDIFGRRIEEMNKTNTAMQGQVGLAGERTGLARYASQMQTGLISKETTAGMNRISELESQKLDAIQKAKDALKSKAKDRWKTFNEFMDSATTAYNNKVQAVKDLHTFLKDEEDRALQKAQFALSTQADVTKLVGDMITSGQDLSLVSDAQKAVYEGGLGLTPGTFDSYYQTAKEVASAVSLDDQVASATKIFDLLNKVPSGTPVSFVDSDGNVITYSGLKQGKTTTYKEINKANNTVTYVTLDENGNIMNTDSITGVSTGYKGSTSNSSNKNTSKKMTFNEWLDALQEQEQITYNLGDPSVESALKREYESFTGKSASQIKLTSAQYNTGLTNYLDETGYTESTFNNLPPDEKLAWSKKKATKTTTTDTTTADTSQEDDGLEGYSF